MRRVLGVLVLAMLTLPGCKKPQQGAPDGGIKRPKKLKPITINPVEAVEPSETATPLPGSDCPLAPSWTRLVPCTEEGWTYAFSEAPIGINPSLSRTKAAQKARWALAEALGQVKEHRVRLVGAEVPEIYACEGTMYALARMHTSDAGLPGCGTTLASRAVAGEGCPEWSRGLAWSEAEGLVGVAQVDNIKSPSLARSAVLGRARHAAAELIELKLDERDDSLSAFTENRTLRTLKEEVARCGDTFWGRVLIAQP